VTPEPATTSDLKVRLVSGIIALLIVLPILIKGTFWWVFGLAAVAAAWSIHEVVTMSMREQRRTAFPLALVLGSGWFVTAAFSTQGGIPGWSLDVDPMLVVGVVTTIGSAVYFLVTATSTDGLGHKWAWFVLGLAYVGLPLGMFASLVELPGGHAWLFAPLFAGWCGDIGGYFAGRAFGRHKMIPLISPKKTWEGFFGGVALAVVGVVVLKVVFVDPWIDHASPLTWLDCLVIGVVADIAGVLGDLTASMIKRTHGAKDSGRFLPGHGGMLDRIDAVMFTVPVVWVWVTILRPLFVQ
jgi:phosphatidate cytidylyltransferase